MPTKQNTNQSQNSIQNFINDINFRFVTDDELNNLDLSIPDYNYYEGYNEALSEVKTYLKNYPNAKHQSNKQIQTNLKNKLSTLTIEPSGYQDRDENDIEYYTGYNEALTELNLKII